MKLKYKIKKLTYPLIFGIAVVYFGHSLVSGKRSIISYFKMEKELDVAEAKLEKLSKERESLDRRVKLMRSNSLDLDLLDEQSRRFLGYADEDEIVIFLDDK